MNNNSFWERMVVNTSGGSPITIIRDNIKYVERKARPMQEICSDAEREKEKVWELNKLRAEILLDQDQFSKVDFDFMQEMIQGFIDEYNDKNTYTMTYQNPNI